MTTTTLAIADDHEILRDALASRTSSIGLEVVASVPDAQAAIDACRAHRPDLLLLDIEMPGRDALAAIPDIRAASPETKVVIFTNYCRDTFIQEAMRHHVAGYLVKADPPTAIFEALDKVAHGHPTFSKSVLARMSAQSENNDTNETVSTRLTSLSPRELEVLRYIGRGLDNTDMADIMFLSKRTVERHVSRLMKSLAIHDRPSLQKFATDHEVV